MGYIHPIYLYKGNILVAVEMSMLYINASASHPLGEKIMFVKKSYQRVINPMYYNYVHKFYAFTSQMKRELLYFYQ